MRWLMIVSVLMVGCESTGVPDDVGAWVLMDRFSLDDDRDARAFDVLPENERSFEFAYSLHGSGRETLAISKISGDGAVKRDAWQGEAVEGVGVDLMSDGDVLLTGPSRQAAALDPLLFSVVLLRTGVQPIEIATSNQMVEVSLVHLGDGVYRSLIPNPGGYGDCGFSSRFVSVSGGGLEAECLPRHLSPPIRWVPNRDGTRFMSGDGGDYLIRFDKDAGTWQASDARVEHSVRVIAQFGDGNGVRAIVQRLGGEHQLELLSWSDDGAVTLDEISGTRGFDAVPDHESTWREHDFCWFDETSLTVYCVNPETRALASLHTSVKREDSTFVTRRVVRANGRLLYLFELNRTGWSKRTAELWGRQLPGL